MVRLRPFSLLLASIAAVACSESSTSPGTPDLAVFDAGQPSARGLSMTDLGVLPGYDSSAANGINDKGVIVGVNRLPGPQHATMWDHGIITDLGVLPTGTYSIAQAVNSSNIVVGVADTGGFPQRGFRWVPGAGMAGLPPLNDGSVSMAFAVNDAGVAVGASDSLDFRFHAVRWDGVVVSSLPVVAGSIGSSDAQGINSAGVIVGSVVDPLGFSRGVVWPVSGPPVLLALPSTFILAYAVAINDAGEIVGYGQDGFTSHALYWANASAPATILSAPPGSYGRATAINRSGAIVGVVSDAAGIHATYWRDASSASQDLGWLPGQLFALANAINRHGNIVGFSAGGPPTRSGRATCWSFRRGC